MTAVYPKVDKERYFSGYVLLDKDNSTHVAITSCSEMLITVKNPPDKGKLNTCLLGPHYHNYKHLCPAGTQQTERYHWVLTTLEFSRTKLEFWKCYKHLYHITWPYDLDNAAILQCILSGVCVLSPHPVKGTNFNSYSTTMGVHQDNQIKYKLYLVITLKAWHPTGYSP